MSDWENIGNQSIVANQTFNAAATYPAVTVMKDIKMNAESEDQKPVWKLVYTSFVLLLMFAALISDKIGADMIMMVALTLLMASNIITIKEGLEGFSNEGLLTVLVLFVVAAGISHTGALVSLPKNSVLFLFQSVPEASNLPCFFVTRTGTWENY